MVTVDELAPHILTKHLSDHILVPAIEQYNSTTAPELSVADTQLLR